MDFQGIAKVQCTLKLFTTQKYIILNCFDFNYLSKDLVRFYNFL